MEPFAARDRVLLAVSYVCSLRVSEPGQLRLEHLEHSDGLYTILIERAKAADRDVRMPIADPIVSRMLGAFLDLRPQITDSPWLFPSRPRNGSTILSSRSTDHIFNRALRQSGIRKRHRRLTFHILHHSIATHLAANGAQARAIQGWMRHKDISTTFRYVHLAESQFRRVWKRHNPLAVQIQGSRRPRRGPRGAERSISNADLSFPVRKTTLSDEIS